MEALKSGVGPTTLMLAVPAAVRRVDGTVAVMEVPLFHKELSVVGDPGLGVTGVHVTVDPLAKVVPAMVSAKWLMPTLAVAPVARLSIRVMAGAALTVRRSEERRVGKECRTWW